MLPIDYQLRMKELLSDEYDGFIRSFEEPGYKALRLNPLKLDRAQFPVFIRDFKNELMDCGYDVSFERVPWEESGYYYSGPDDLRLGNQVFHEAGAYYIQEPSAMKPVTMLDVCPGLRVLDLCAAPGGKSTQIAGYMEGKGVLVSNEIIPSRAEILSRNIERLGVRNAIVLNETPQRLSDVFAGWFDRILVDAPCSGEGMFRKNPEAVNEWSVLNVKKCAARQDEILDCAATMLKHGGILVYSTCTFSREEDEECMERFLNRHPDYELVCYEKLLPHKIRGEGHFVAKLARKGERGNGYFAASLSEDPKGRRNKGNKVSERLSLFDDLLSSDITDAGLDGRYIFFGDNLYLMPDGSPDPDGLKTVRPGLWLGSYAGGKGKPERFVPSHSFALALKPCEVTRMVDITFEKARSFIEGLTLPLPDTYGGDDKGWCLVCCEGISLGFGKIAGGMIKNHYPKGIRMHI